MIKYEGFQYDRKYSLSLSIIDIERGEEWLESVARTTTWLYCELFEVVQSGIQSAGEWY